MNHPKLAYIFNEYMHTLGGGERHTLDYALALKNLGFRSKIVTTQQAPSIDTICELFGPQYQNLEIIELKKPEIFNKISSEKASIFVNQTSNSKFPNPAQFGIYSQMFPMTPWPRKPFAEWIHLRSYDLMLCNSSFTMEYTEQLWDYPFKKMKVLHPPVWCENAPKNIDEFELAIGQKQKKILHIGRFNPGNHNKNQLIIIRSFLKAKSHLPEWSIDLVGNVNTDPQSQSYFNECLALAEQSNGSVRIHSGLCVQKLNNLLEKAFFYVHATGADIPNTEHPERCEHLGLSILEGAAWGCIPIVYNRGGIFDLLSPGRSCLAYSSEDELQGLLGIIEGICSSRVKTELQHAAREAALANSFEHFTKSLSVFLPPHLIS
jgi:glycosyltransferase involved in cell wall biosynthesis